MNLKPILSLLLVGVLSVSLTACGPKDEEHSDQSSESTVSQPDESKPDFENSPFTLAVFPASSMHPVLGTNPANLTLAPLLYEPLFQVDEHFNAVPVLCQEYSVSSDKLVWTFTLREGVVFSDGAALTGKLAADALNLARSEGSQYAPRFRDVVSITGKGQTLTITLARPNGRLPQLLDIPISNGAGNRPAGSGPYALTGEGDRLSLTARSDWWQTGKKLPQNTIQLAAFHESEELIYAFDTGAVSMVEVDMMGTGSLGYTDGSATCDYSTTDLIYVGFNTQRGLGKSPEFRKAVTRAIDRKSIVQTIFANHAVLSELPVHPDSPLYDSAAAAAFSYEPQHLTDLVSKSYSGRALTFLVNSENPAKVNTAQLIAYQLRSAGLNVNLRKLPFADYAAALAAGSYDLYLGEVSLTADFDLTALLAPGGAVNYSGWANPAAPALIAALAAADQESAPKAARALFDLLAQDPPMAAVCFKNGSVLSQWGRLDQISPVRGNVFYQLENWIIQ